MACVQIAVLSDVLEDNGMDMDAILDAQLGGDGYGEDEEDQAGSSQQQPGDGSQTAEGPDVEGKFRKVLTVHHGMCLNMYPIFESEYTPKDLMWKVTLARSPRK